MISAKIIMTEKKRFAINTFAQTFSFLVGLGITFFLTPFIVEKLGTAAYGFVGLASSFVGYTQLITVALNSMAGRFITICVHKNDMEGAQKYFSSVFYSNLIFIGIICVISIIAIYKLEYIIKVPEQLLSDVKLLFACMFLNLFINLLFNVYNVCTFIKNRLDLSSIRIITSNFIKALLLVVLFYFFKPSVWFIGLASVISSIYIVITNFQFRKLLVPDLYVSRHAFDFQKIKELFSSGIWNVISRINGILGHELDLLIANLFIGTFQMGVIAITRRIPSLMLTFYERINAVFSPNWTKLYAQNRWEELHASLLTSIRFFGTISFIPLAILFVYCDWFYALWLPSQDARQLYILTIVACIDLPFAMPLQPIYNVYPIVNKIRANSLFGIGLYSATFLVVFVGVLLTKNTWHQMLILASTRAIFNTLKSLTFLPLYGGYCAKIRPSLLYKNTFKSIFAFGILSTILFLIKTLFVHISWTTLGFSVIISSVIGSVIGYILILDTNDKKIVKKIGIKAKSKIFKRDQQ